MYWYIYRIIITIFKYFFNFYIETYSNDLEAFAHHGKRTKINVDDVLLCARKDPELVFM